MSTTTTPDLRLLPILESDHMTATVTTESGTRYTVIARPKVGVVVIDDAAGLVYQGLVLMLSRLNHMYLIKDADGETMLHTAPITHVSILTN